MDANANGWHGASIKAAILTKIGSGERASGEENNAEWRPRTPVPFGLLLKTPIAALQSLAGCATPFAFAPFAGRFRLCNAFVPIALTGPRLCQAARATTESEAKTTR